MSSKYVEIEGLITIDLDAVWAVAPCMGCDISYKVYVIHGSCEEILVYGEFAERVSREEFEEAWKNWMDLDYVRKSLFQYSPPSDGIVGTDLRPYCGGFADDE